jgi:hypothetical protein
LTGDPLSRDCHIHSNNQSVALVEVTHAPYTLPRGRRRFRGDFSVRRLCHHNLAPPQEIATAIERDEKRHGEQTTRNDAHEKDQIPNFMV